MSAAGLTGRPSTGAPYCFTIIACPATKRSAFRCGVVLGTGTIPVLYLLLRNIAAAIGIGLPRRPIAFYGNGTGPVLRFTFHLIIAGRFRGAPFAPLGLTLTDDQIDGGIDTDPVGGGDALRNDHTSRYRLVIFFGGGHIGEAPGA